MPAPSVFPSDDCSFTSAILLLEEVFLLGSRGPVSVLQRLCEPEIQEWEFFSVSSIWSQPKSALCLGREEKFWREFSTPQPVVDCCWLLPYVILNHVPNRTSHPDSQCQRFFFLFLFFSSLSSPMPWGYKSFLIFPPPAWVFHLL